MKAETILETIGNTPHVKLNRLFDPRISVWLKLERANPGGSIKDRVALAMITAAEQQGLLVKASVIIEPTSGNTGIGLAMVAAVKGYRLILTMPESMSLERRRYLAALGAELVLTPSAQGMAGAISEAKRLAEITPNSWLPQQFENPANIEAHCQTTAREILTDFPEGLDYLIAGVGTGGHISGCAEVLKREFPRLKVYAVEPQESSVLSGGSPNPHLIQGIGAGFVPKNLRTDLLDGVIQVTGSEAYRAAARCAREEGILIGISSGATLAAVEKKRSEFPNGSTIVTFCYDTGERYLSVEGFIRD